MQESVGLRIKRVDNGEIKQLNALMSTLPQADCKEFYLQRGQDQNYSFTVTLTDAGQIDSTLTLISEVVEAGRIEIINH